MLGYCNRPGAGQCGRSQEQVGKEGEVSGQATVWEWSPRGRGTGKQLALLHRPSHKFLHSLRPFPACFLHIMRVTSSSKHCTAQFKVLVRG